MRISDWSSDVCSSDLANRLRHMQRREHVADGNEIRESRRKRIGERQGGVVIAREEGFADLDAIKARGNHPHVTRPGKRLHMNGTDLHRARGLYQTRSEERRVGKESVST